MNGLWQLPQSVDLGWGRLPIRTDYRLILKIIYLLEDPDLPEISRWLVALRLFYETPVPAKFRQKAMGYLAWFIGGGQTHQPGRKLLDWQQDCDAIVSGINQVAGQEIRSLPYLHWWTFLSWFHAISQGQLSTLVAIRDKLSRGQPLERWEKEFYAQNKKKVDLQPRLSQREREEKERLQALLGN